MSKYSKLSSYVEKADPELYEIYEKLCMNDLFSSKKGGVTFIHPKDADYRDVLFELSKSDEEEDIEILTKMLQSLIVTGCYKTPLDIMSNRDNIVNKLNQRIDIKGANGQQIITKLGAVLSVEPSYVDGSKKQCYAVWRLESGKIDINAPEIKTASKTADATDTANLSIQDNIYLRQNIIKFVENSYVRDLTKTSHIDRYKNIYIEVELNLLDYLMTNEYCSEVLYNYVLPMVTFTKPDIYILVEPYKNTRVKSIVKFNYLINDKILKDWFNSYDRDVNYAKVYARVNELLDRGVSTVNGASSVSNVSIVNTVNTVNSSNVNANDSSKSEVQKSPILMYSNAQSMLNQINESRLNLLKNAVAPQTIISAITKQYEAMFTYNILPPKLIKFYEKATAKMYEDDLRYMISMDFYDIESSQSFEIGRFQEMSDSIRVYTCGDSIEPKLLQKINSPLPPTERIAEIKTFINSTFFFSVPMSDETLKNYPHKFVTSKPDSNKPALYNYVAASRNQMKLYLNAMSKYNQPRDEDLILKEKLAKLKKEGKLEAYLNSLN